MPVHEHRAAESRDFGKCRRASASAQYVSENAAEELAHRQQVPVREMIKEIERAYVDAAETQYGKGNTFWASVQDVGAIKLAQVLKVVEEVKTPQREVARSNLLETDPDVQLGHYVVNTIEPIHPPKFA